MRVAIVGANSSIARNYVYYLKNEHPDVEIMLYDIQEASLDYEADYSQVNFSDEQSVEKIDFTCDLLYFFTGVTGAANSVKNPALFVEVNERYLVMLLMEAVRQKAQCRIIYPSSRLVYQDIASDRLENAALVPKSVYAVNKIAAEQYLKVFHDVYGLKYTIFRIAIPFGSLKAETDRFGIVAVLKSQAEQNKAIRVYGDGNGVRTFTHIEDICYVLYEGSIREETLNETFNIGGNVGTLRQVAEAVAETTGSTVEHVQWPLLEECVEVSNGYLNSEKIDRILNMRYKDMGIH